MKGDDSMQVIDFEYDGILLSSFNLVVCNFSGGGGIDTVSIGNKLTLNKIKAANSSKHKTTGYKYDEVFSTSFQIGKVGCNTDNNVISDIELNKILRWLNRKNNFKFKVIYDDGSFSNAYYNGIFNVEAIKYGDDIIGLNLKFESDSPYAYMDNITFEQKIDQINSSLIINDVSMETGYIYPDVKIELLEPGNIIINNEYDPNPIIINNCVLGEIIILNGDSKIISSNIPQHTTLANDFNYNFLRIVNQYNNVKNVFTSNLNCKITITYSPILKVGSTL